MTQGPPDPTVSTVLRKLQNNKRRSYEEELIELQTREIGIQRRVRWLLDRILPGHSTDELPPVAPQTPPAFQMSPELQEERQRVSDSLHQPRHVAQGDPPTQQLHNPAEIARIAALDTVIMALPDTGDIPLGPIRLTTLDVQPRESFYTSDDALVLLIAHAVKAHQQKFAGIAPNVIEMPEEVFSLLAGRINMTEYVTADRHIPFAINTTLPTTTITNTVKCITY